MTHDASPVIATGVRNDYRGYPIFVLDETDFHRFRTGMAPFNIIVSPDATFGIGSLVEIKPENYAQQARARVQDIMPGPGNALTVTCIWLEDAAKAAQHRIGAVLTQVMGMGKFADSGHTWYRAINFHGWEGLKTNGRLLNNSGGPFCKGDTLVIADPAPPRPGLVHLFRVEENQGADHMVSVTYRESEYTTPDLSSCTTSSDLPTSPSAATN